MAIVQPAGDGDVSTQRFVRWWLIAVAIVIAAVLLTWGWNRMRAERGLVEVQGLPPQGVHLGALDDGGASAAWSLMDS